MNERENILKEISTKRDYILNIEGEIMGIVNLIELIYLCKNNFMDCPKCSCKNCAKNGKNSANLQKYICLQCRFTFCPESTCKQISKELKTKCLQLYLEGLGFRAIGRVLGFSFKSACNIIRAEGLKLKAEAQKILPVDIIEMDEIHTYVAKKKLHLDLDSHRQERKKVYQLRDR